MITYLKEGTWMPPRIKVTVGTVYVRFWHKPTISTSAVTSVTGWKADGRFTSAVSAIDPYLTLRLDLSKEHRGINFSRRRPAICAFCVSPFFNTDRAQVY